MNKASEVYAINSSNEIIAVAGTGNDTPVGYLSQDKVMVNEDNKMVIANYHTTVPAIGNTGDDLPVGRVIDFYSDTQTVDAVITRYGFLTGAAFLCRHARGTYSTPSATLLDDTMGVFGARGRGTLDWVTGSKANMRIRASENWTDSATGTRIEFTTTTVGTTTANTRFTISDSGRLSVAAATQIPEYADDAAAAVGGLVVGTFYRTGSVLKVRVA